MSIENENVKERLESKAHDTIIVGIALTVLTGVLLYLLPIVCEMSTSLLIIGFLMFIVCLTSSYFLKVPTFFIVNSFLIWISPLITILLHMVSPKYNIMNQNHLLAMEIVVYFLFIACWIVSVAILRLFIGYEKLYKPIIYSYAVNDEINERFLKEFKKLFRLLGAKVVSVFRTKKTRIIEFIYEKDRYIACFHPKENRGTELDIIVFKLHRDTIIQPVRENIEVFFSLFEAAAIKWNEQKKIPRLETEKNPRFLRETEDILISLYASPIRIRVPIPKPSIAEVKSFIERHPNLISFITGIIATVIAGIILSYITRILSF